MSEHTMPACSHCGGVTYIAGRERPGSTESISWCKGCGLIVWANDAYGSEALGPDRVAWVSDYIVAFSCANETRTGNLCKTWCGHPRQCLASYKETPGNPEPRSET